MLNFIYNPIQEEDNYNYEDQRFLNKEYKIYHIFEDNMFIGYCLEYLKYFNNEKQQVYIKVHHTSKEIKDSNYLKIVKSLSKLYGSFYMILCKPNDLLEEAGLVINKEYIYKKVYKYEYNDNPL